MMFETKVIINKYDLVNDSFIHFGCDSSANRHRIGVFGVVDGKINVTPLI